MTTWLNLAGPSLLILLAISLWAVVFQLVRGLDSEDAGR